MPIPILYLADMYKNVTTTTNINKGVILEIRRERRIELVMEKSMQRWDDIMRWRNSALCLTRPFRYVLSRTPAIMI